VEDRRQLDTQTEQDMASPDRRPSRPSTHEHIPIINVRYMASDSNDANDDDDDDDDDASGNLLTHSPHSTPSSPRSLY